MGVCIGACSHPTKNSSEIKPIEKKNIADEI
jgi:hypothetical protein